MNHLARAEHAVGLRHCLHALGAGLSLLTFTVACTQDTPPDDDAAATLALQSSALPVDSASARNVPDDDAIRPFRVAVPGAELAELRRRIRATRWPGKETVDDGSQGVQQEKLQALLQYWGTGYDWRKAEARLNSLPQFVTTIDSLDIHFIHVRSRHADALPLVMTHGWPGSVFELLGTIGPLTDPTRFGGRPEDAFHLVLPSLPGYGFSGRPRGPGWGPDRIAGAWDVLMKRLGYGRYVAQGGDWGAVIAHTLGRRAPAGLLGIHVNLPATVPPEVATMIGTGPAPTGLSVEERAAFEAVDRFYRKHRGYSVMMATRPQTIGYALADSPVGLAAWMYDFNDGEPERLLTRDEVLDDFTLHWLTNGAASAARLYWENGGRGLVVAAAQQTDEISLPVAVSVFPEEIYRAPETWARRAYPTLIYFNEVDRGGHFAAWEEPELFSSELRAAFRPLRDRDPARSRALAGAP